MWKKDFRTTIHFYGEKKKNSHKLLWHSTPKDFCSQNVSLQIPLYYGQFVWTLKWVQRTWTPQLCDLDTLLYPFTVPFLRSCHLSGCRYYQAFVYRWELWRLFWAIRQIAYVWPLPPSVFPLSLHIGYKTDHWLSYFILLCRRIYPEGNEEKYAVFFENSCSLFQETAASKARIECARWDLWRNLFWMS